ncbi:HNH endonuclease [Streptomyces fildesensis]|uniref:HNH endonuclease n=1 Tax=Streptomyces fildesensis TaxID=375757 RepID=A0ABW8CJM5_9ACTN
MTGYTADIAGNVTPGDQAKRLWKHTTVRRHVHSALGKTLAAMAPGLDRCMYCGDSQGTDIDHFEPMSRAPLRTFDWNNHLLACSLCNSHTKRDLFPVDAAGRPLLIDPSTEDPALHLHLVLAAGEYIALTPRGEATRKVFDLNRGVLVRGRRNVYRITRLCLEDWYAAYEEGDEAALREWTSTILEQPTAEVVYAMFHQAVAPGARDIFAGDPGTLKLLRNPEVRVGLLTGL